MKPTGKTAKDPTEEIWSRVINLNLHGCMRFIHALIHHMVERWSGKIINIASIAAEVGIIDRVDYSAAKGGVISMSRTLAMEVGHYEVTVNRVSPGLISRSENTYPSSETCLGRNGGQKEVAGFSRG